MPIYSDWISGVLAQRIASNFWDLAKPKKRQKCLDIGCGVGFLVYPWREWDASFYGHEVSAIAQQGLTSRGPQLNSKLFKGCRLAPAHRLEYEENFFDLVISTGVSCYYGPDYWETVMAQVRRVLKPEGLFLFDVINPDLPLAENWAILETYLGAEVNLTPIDTWKPLVKASGARIVSHRENELFRLLKVKW
ncbi:SAM-dependent methyltransferase [filamentous cyanobacterium CCP5]|nr:SAM-dependent methyltransferase [filamentous cyanobacterium CCP5]